MLHIPVLNLDGGAVGSNNMNNTTSKFYFIKFESNQTAFNHEKRHHQWYFRSSRTLSERYICVKKEDEKCITKSKITWLA